MASIHMTDPSGREQEYPIGPKPQVFGRGEDSDVVLGSRSVARHHMRIWEKDGRVMVEDLTSGRGIKLDGTEANGTFELTLGVDMEVGVFIFALPGRIETDVEGQMLEEEMPVPVLEGTKGPTRGLEIELQEGDNDVGRDPDHYLVIDDASVSRLHARLTVKAGQVHLVDMRSSNGTFVNKKRIETRDLQSGDLVKFGNLEFRFVCGSIVSKDAMALKRKRLILVGVGTVVVVALMMVIFIRACTVPPKQTDPVPIDKEVPIEQQVDLLLREARKALEDFKLQLAKRKVAEALDLHPISTPAREMSASIDEEIGYESIYNDGKNLYDLNKWSDALIEFRKIPASSIFYKRVRYKISEIVEKLVNYHLKEAKSYYKVRDFTKAHQNLIAFMSLRPCDRQVYNKWVKKIELALRRQRRRFTPIKYDCKDEQANARAASEEKADPEELLRSAYPDPEIFKAMLLYYKGNVKVAKEALTRVKKRSKDKAVAEKAKELEQQLMIIDGKYKQGLGHLLEDDLKKAQEDFGTVLVADERIMPGGIRSRYREEIQKGLAERYYKLGLEQYNRQHWRESFEYYMKCNQANPADRACLRGLRDLEERGNEALQAAENALREGNPKWAKHLWNLIQRFTRPESYPYKKAQRLLKKYTKR